MAVHCEEEYTKVEMVRVSGAATRAMTDNAPGSGHGASRRVLVHPKSCARRIFVFEAVQRK